MMPLTKETNQQWQKRIRTLVEPHHLRLMTDYLDGNVTDGDGAALHDPECDIWVSLDMLVKILLGNGGVI